MRRPNLTIPELGALLVTITPHRQHKHTQDERADMEHVCLLLWTLVLALSVAETHGTFPYLSMGSGNRSNHSYLVFSSLGAPDSLLDLRCHTDLTSCCNSGDGADRGDWYYPNGTRLSFRDNALFFLRRSQRVSLGRNQELTVDAAAEGIYRCSIETNAVRSDDSSDTTVGEVIYVGIYTGDDGTYVLH